MTTTERVFVVLACSRCGSKRKHDLGAFQQHHRANYLVLGTLGFHCSRCEETVLHKITGRCTETTRPLTPQGVTKLLKHGIPSKSETTSVLHDLPD